MTNLIPQHKAALVACGLVLPSAAVLLSGLLGSGVSQLQASTADPATHLPELPGTDLTRAVEGWDDDRAVSSPFWVEPVSTGPHPAVTKGPVDPINAVSEHSILPADRFRVTSVMPNTRNPLAVIDGRPRRVGDKLDGGWTIEAINADDHSVSLVHTSGARARIGLKNTP